jgi:hypothetical protein
MWQTPRMSEQKKASATPKSPNLWFEVIPQISYLGQFFQCIQDLIEKFHKLDRLTNVVNCHIQNYAKVEEDIAL